MCLARVNCVLLKSFFPPLVYGELMCQEETAVSDSVSPSGPSHRGRAAGGPRVSSLRGREADPLKWMAALGHESISDTFWTKCVRGFSPCCTEPKQTQYPGPEKNPSRASHHSGHLLLPSAVLILWPTVLSLALLSCQPLQPPVCTCACTCVSLP